MIRRKEKRFSFCQYFLHMLAVLDFDFCLVLQFMDYERSGVRTKIEIND